MSEKGKDEIKKGRQEHEVKQSDRLKKKKERKKPFAMETLVLRYIKI